MTDTAHEDAHAPVWGHQILVEAGQAARIRLGPVELLAHRRAYEWRVVHRVDRDDTVRNDVAVEVTDVDDADADALEEGQVYRYAFSALPDRFELRPRLADRPVVVRPVHPLRLVGGAAVDLYVSTPVWVAMVLQPGSKELFDEPTLRPSDTWFGEDTISGELCYASRTNALLEVDRLQRRPSRAITRLRVINHAATTASLERVLLPAPQLALYVDPAGDLWTQPVEIALSSDAEEAGITLLSSPTQVAPDARLITAARRPLARPLIARALSALWR